MVVMVSVFCQRCQTHVVIINANIIQVTIDVIHTMELNHFIRRIELFKNIQMQKMSIRQKKNRFQLLHYRFDNFDPDDNLLK